MYLVLIETNQFPLYFLLSISELIRFDSLNYSESTIASICGVRYLDVMIL
jgi:CO dehydrogenase/acetyl-CoA synthase gamma subunit (corrinoid Fe-S protein)